MTADELRAKFGVAYKIIARERRWREHVFPPGNPRHDEKLREMDRLLEVLTELKDELKARIGEAYEQGTLVDVPAAKTRPEQFR